MYSITDTLAALTVSITLTITALVQANDSLNTAKSFNQIAIEKIANTNFFKYQNEMIQNNYLEERVFTTKEGYSVKVSEDKSCGAYAVKINVWNKFHKTELTSCTKRFYTNKLKIEEV